jgi:AcrR family transcriptional regulator
MHAQQPLADVKRQAAVDHVLTAARRLVMAHGLVVTMDQIAQAAGVSRRTVFRLFDSRDRLIADAFSAALVNYDEHLPAYDGDLTDWLHATCQAAHRMNSSFGPGFWEITTRTDLPPDLAAHQRHRQHERRRMMAHVAATLWNAAGGAGDAPPPLVDVIGAHLSAHFTATVMIDVGKDWQTAADMACAAIWSVLERHLPVTKEG